MRGRKPLIGQLGESHDGGRQCPNFELDSLLVYERFLDPSVDCVHQQIRHAHRTPNRLLLRFLCFPPTPHKNHKIKSPTSKFPHANTIQNILQEERENEMILTGLFAERERLVVVIVDELNQRRFESSEFGSVHDGEGGDSGQGQL